MAQAVLSTITGGILEKLCSVAFQEIGQWWGVNDELGKLKNTVTTINVVLHQAESQPTMSDQVKIYIENLKEVLYDADDLLDDFSTEALRQQVMSGNNMATLVRNFFSSLTQPFYGRNMANEIKAIREKLDAIKADKEFLVGKELQIGEVSAGKQVVSRETHSYIGAEEVIGRDDDKVKIIDLLMGSNSEDNVSIILIVGMGGLGKTALVQLVYNDDKIKNHFEKKLWVCVSDVFAVKTIIENIIKSATGREPGNIGMDQLQLQLRKELDGKKYLLVLDDVWNEDREEWIKLERLLMGGVKGSRIVVTTRSRRVAEITSTGSPYFLKGLSETYSWSLFARMAFGQGKEPTNQSIEAIGKEIVDICVGVPLAIRVMGSLLYRKSELEWTYFKNELSYLSKEKREIEHSQSPKKRKIELSKLPQPKDGILPTLKLSYNNLEPHLKHCFAYCRLFPKDHTIDVKKLIYHWMGQGFIKSSNSSQSLEQIGYECFLLLLWRSFFQDPREDEWGNIVFCKMHDLMHDLAVEIAGTESTIISSDKEIILRNTHHVSFDLSIDLPRKIPVHSLEANNVRTFLLVNDFYILSNEDICAIVSKFTHLRMLDLHKSVIEKVPKLIGELKHLRYLDLSWNDQFKFLPSSITRLQNLLVLDLSGCTRLKELPEDIKKLVSLEHLEIDECDSLTHMPQGLGQLTSLQKLTRFIVSKHCGGLNELNGLNNLRGKLMVENLRHVKNADLEYKAANLERKEHLQTLMLNWGRFDGNDNIDAMSMDGLQPNKNLRKLHVSQYPGVRFPNWLSSLTNLVYLILRDCERIKHLPPLDGLSSLRDLSIDFLSNLEYIDCNGSNCSRSMFFSSLEKLNIRDCPNLKGWRIVSMVTTTTSSSSSTTELPPFPCLCKLQIENCTHLTSMPLFPSIQGDLVLYRASGKPLQDTMAASMSTSSSSSPPLPLSKLTSLDIRYINDLEYLPDQGLLSFNSLTSLRSLQIQSCQMLKSISGVFQHCTALEKLFIGYCQELDFSDGLQFQGLKSLSSLKIEYLPQLVSLPEELQHVTTLQVLVILSCKNFKTLPHWIGSLTSLQKLYISFCSQFTSLPEGMRRLTSLQELSISYCPQLSERCRNNMGVDWPKIAHIPNIEINNKKIQSGGCYQLG